MIGAAAASTSETDLSDVCWMFEQITLRHGIHADRSAIRRSVDEGAKFVAELPDSSWYRWLVESAHSLGFVARVVEGPLPDLIGIAGDGMFVIMRSQAAGPWHLLSGSGSRRMLFLQPRGDKPIQTLRPRQVTSRLQTAGVSGLQKCVVI